MQHQGCLALQVLADYPRNAVKIASCGGVKAVLAAMRCHESSPRLQVAACGAMRSLSTNNTDNRAEIGSCGGVEAVLAVMRCHESSADVQAAACGALRSLSTNTPVNRAKVHSCGGIEAVLAAMRSHASSCLLYTSPSPRDRTRSRMPSSA